MNTFKKLIELLGQYWKGFKTLFEDDQQSYYTMDKNDEPIKVFKTRDGENRFKSDEVKTASVSEVKVPETVKTQIQPILKAQLEKMAKKELLDLASEKGFTQVTKKDTKKTIIQKILLAKNEYSAYKY